MPDVKTKILEQAKKQCQANNAMQLYQHVETFVSNLSDKVQMPARIQYVGDSDGNLIALYWGLKAGMDLGVCEDGTYHFYLHYLDLFRDEISVSQPLEQQVMQALEVPIIYSSFQSWYC